MKPLAPYSLASLDSKDSSQFAICPDRTQWPKTGPRPHTEHECQIAHGQIFGGAVGGIAVQPNICTARRPEAWPPLDTDRCPLVTAPVCCCPPPQVDRDSACSVISHKTTHPPFIHHASKQPTRSFDFHRRRRRPPDPAPTRPDDPVAPNDACSPPGIILSLFREGPKPSRSSVLFRVCARAFGFRPSFPSTSALGWLSGSEQCYGLDCMPRPSASAKRQQGGASNQRDTRHEAGSVGPGKRISKQKSQNLADGAASTASTPNASCSPLPPVPSSPPNANGCPKQSVDMSADTVRRGSLGTYSEASSESFSATSLAQEEQHRRIDVNATKNSNVHRDTGPFDFALTVLRSCPLQDTIAILIILMQIPPVALSAIYMLFTLLTFVTTNSGLTLSDVFEWNLGAPSVATVVCVDGIVLLIWLFLWGPIQHVILDLAQMVIALGLGGGSSSRDSGSMKNSLICLSMILLSHALRHTKMKYSPVGYLLGSSRFMTPDLDDPLESLESIRGYDKVRSGWTNWVRSILAIHILTQGLVKAIRDWYLRRERRDSMAQAVDPEAGKPYVGEISTDGGFSTPDSDATSLQPQSALNSKKKRKQSAQIRNRQPLWAAIASTKIVVVKEYELTHSAVDSAGSNATDIHNLGNAPFNTEANQIWISYVGCDEVCFNTSHFPSFVASPGNQESGNSSRIDLSKPFYVRVNHAVWQPTRITAVQDPQRDGSQGTTWSGDIYGLTPLSNYECEFVSTVTHEVLFSTSVRTMRAKTADIDAATAKPSGQSSLRPDSPTTTLKTSIAASEAKLAEEKARQKALRKEWHRKANALKKENEKLSAAVQSAGAGDDKLRQKIQQNTTQQKQAEQALATLAAELKEFDVIPESLKAAWKAKQSAYSSEKYKYDKANAEFRSFKANVDGQVKSLVDEKTSLEAKRNKISSRIAKVDGEHARIADANARGLDEAERRRQDRAALETQFTRWELDLLEKVASHEAESLSRDEIIVALKAQLDAFHSQQSSFYNSSYDFPDPAAAGQLPTTSAGPSSSIAAAYDAATAWSNSAYNASLWGPSPLAPGFVPQSTPFSQLQSTTKRGRSSSMLSDVSGFTQSSANDDDLANAVADSTQMTHSGPFRPPPGFGYSPYLQGDADVVSDESSSSSGSASGSPGSTGSDSIRDPMSPPPS
ncbi:putative Ubiquitination network signaling protein acrB [Seiridium cardinale]|uniref:Ubiquitination network signaling protein acrB n=1 Tax=Seiridium cardinale TaxID=138064 RepID=A0ABR2X6M7_9PEZI